MRAVVVAAVAVAALVIAGYWALPRAEDPPRAADARVIAAPRSVIGPGFRPREQTTREPVDVTPHQGPVAELFSPDQGATISPEKLRENQASGERRIAPDLSTRSAILESGRRIVYPVFKVCVSPTGSVSDVEVVVTSGFEHYDQDLAATIQDWRYTPFVDEAGRAIDVCSSVVLPQVIY